jgi:hypothetical protein
VAFELRDPTAQSAAMAGPAATLAARPQSLRGLRLCLLDNGKNNARQLLEAVLERVSGELAPAEVIWRNVPATLPAPPELLDGIATECDVVIQAVGD